MVHTLLWVSVNCFTNIRAFTNLCVIRAGGRVLMPTTLTRQDRMSTEEWGVKEPVDSQDSGVSSVHLRESQVVSEALFSVYVINQACLQSTHAGTSAAVATQLLAYQV